MRYGPMSELLRAVSRFAIVGVVGGMAAACSSDSMRFAENPFSDPFAPGQGEPVRTGSIDAGAPAAVTPMPRTTISSAPLAAPGAAPARVAQANLEPAYAPSHNVAGTNPAYKPGAPSQQQAALPSRITPVTPSPVRPPAVVAQAAPQGHVVTRYKLVEGKKSLVEKPLSERHVAERPVAERRVAERRVVEAPRLAAAPSHTRPGQTASRAKPVRQARIEEPAAKVAHPRPGRVVAAAAVAAPAPVKVAEKAPVPAKIAKAEPVKPVVSAPAPAQVAQVAKPAKAVEPVKVASVAPAKIVQPEPVKVSAAPSKEPESTGALTPAPALGTTAEFRWPARGRVITGFGGSGSNEGINIAVPEGTPVKAAEAGTVAYAGSEVKGYGNLVLIRHENGYVSAYAHNGDIEVKRGQKVTRGQLIAKSGQSGNVTSPQLHFEIRKGSTPVDPVPHLASN